MIASLSTPHIQALNAIGNRARTAAELGVPSWVTQQLEARKLFIAERDGYFPLLYRITALGREVVELLNAEVVYIEHEPPVARIQRLTATYFHIPLIEMVSARRSRCVARPRQIAMYLCKQLTPKSLPEIGRRFGGRDHTTVIHAIRQIETLKAVDGSIAKAVETLTEQITNAPESLHREDASATSVPLVSAEPMAA